MSDTPLYDDLVNCPACSMMYRDPNAYWCCERCDMIIYEHTCKYHFAPNTY